ncbi:hypothetical protein BS50DRAFT_214600 [Corynespora cassiicola Philippines]|uniref:Uncharacterized protein n=1 Tax=Corynespora cassiicola Philippines TaxID=1448308 RepID=A0A2T2N5J9_CORCC|nr:hypothetical protein BS50DRAFT_214600 [Corynespora cassiicola Philippines]
MCRSGVWLRMAACSCRSTAGTAGLRCRRLVRIPGKDYGEGGLVDWRTDPNAEQQPGRRIWEALERPGGRQRHAICQRGSAMPFARGCPHRLCFISDAYQHVEPLPDSHDRKGRGAARRMANSKLSTARAFPRVPDGYPLAVRNSRGPRSMDASANEQAQDEVKRLSWLVWASRQSSP